MPLWASSLSIWRIPSTRGILVNVSTEEGTKTSALGEQINQKSTDYK
jgi:hypothetical protein